MAILSEDEFVDMEKELSKCPKRQSMPRKHLEEIKFFEENKEKISEWLKKYGIKRVAELLKEKKYIPESLKYPQFRIIVERMGLVEKLPRYRKPREVIIDD